jgi:hypothetical protein
MSEQQQDDEAPAFKGGDRVFHASTGPATVAGRKGSKAHLGPNGELKVRPDEPHHSGKEIVEIMARRVELIDAA